MMSLSASAKPGLPQLRGALARPPWRLRTAPGRPKVARVTNGQHPGADGANDGAALGPQERPQVPEWETQPVGDGFDGQRQRLREQWMLGSTDPGPEEELRLVQEKLRRDQQKLREQELRWIRNYESFGKEGHRQRQRYAHWAWMITSRQLLMLQQDPSQFIRRFGLLRGFTAKDAAALEPGITQADPSAAGRQSGTRASLAARLRLESEKLESEERWCREKWENCGEGQDEEGKAYAAALLRHAVHKRWLLRSLPLLYRAWHPVVGDPWALPIYNLLVFSVLTPPVIWLVERAQCLLSE